MDCPYHPARYVLEPALTEKKIPASYCLWCEENLATKKYWPYCSLHCSRYARGR